MLAQLQKNKPLYRRIRLILLVTGCLCFSIGLYVTWYHFLSDTSVDLRFSAGRMGTRRHQLAELLRDTAEPAGVHLHLVSTAGSEEALAEVNSGALDVAFVSSGVIAKNKENIRELAAFQVEPMHLLIRKELAEQPGLLRHILRGKRVNLGEPGSSDYALSQELLAFARMQPGNDFVPMNLGVDELLLQTNEIQHATGKVRDEKLQALPDAILLVVSMPSKVAQELIEAADYRLVPLPFGRAFVTNSVKDESMLNNSIDHSYMEQTVILAGSYLGSVPTPQKDCETIGLRLLLVANKNVPAHAIVRLMSKIFDGEFARRVKPISPTDMSSPYDVHLGSLAYLNRNKPYLLNELIETGKKIMSAFGIFSAGALSFFALLRTKKNKSAGDYLTEIRQVDLIARGIVSDSQAPTETHALVCHLDDRLAKLKSELIHDCCNKKFKNEMMLLNILTILVDTRKQVNDLLTSAKTDQPVMKRLAKAA